MRRFRLHGVRRLSMVSVCGTLPNADHREHKRIAQNEIDIDD